MDRVGLDPCHRTHGAIRAPAIQEVSIGLPLLARLRRSPKTGLGFGPGIDSNERTFFFTWHVSGSTLKRTSWAEELQQSLIRRTSISADTPDPWRLVHGHEPTLQNGILLTLGQGPTTALGVQTLLTTELENRMA